MRGILVLVLFLEGVAPQSRGLVDSSGVSSIWASIREDFDVVCEPDYDPLDEEGMDGVVRDVASFLLAFAPHRVVQVKTES